MLLLDHSAVNLMVRWVWFRSSMNTSRLASPWQQMAKISDVSPPDEGLDAGIVQTPTFKLSHEEVGIGGGHPCAHCCAVDLEVVLFPKDKRVLVQDLGDQLCQVSCWW